MGILYAAFISSRLSKNKCVAAKRSHEISTLGKAPFPIKMAKWGILFISIVESLLFWGTQ
jgi:hypothetical protein